MCARACVCMRVVVCSVVYVSLAACCSVVSAEHCLAEQRAELPYTLQIQTMHHIRVGRGKGRGWERQSKDESSRKWSEKKGETGKKEQHTEG